MITLFYAAKGGSGTTTVACSRAIHSPGPTLVVDLSGDVAAVLGVADTHRPGVVDWLHSAAPPEHLDDLVSEAAPDLSILAAHEAFGRPPRGVGHVDDERWARLADWLDDWAHDAGGHVVVDAGVELLPAAFAERCEHRWLVSHACYLALRHAVRLTVSPTAVVLVDEPGRGLSRRDVETAAGAPVVATIPWDPNVSRAVDSGLLISGRIPRSMARCLARAGR